ncbi:hypothetical protein L2E82_31055 [Cichorium intybus]|uniref:Uncharacterized protein n=1 Tax=Cichorium intybus TaxID=13427 RepID=A0ACB9D1W5_CICIN|nr:hypothetical protein L2E82_31055 [Cichorium intybus]
MGVAVLFGVCLDVDFLCVEKSFLDSFDRFFTLLTWANLDVLVLEWVLCGFASRPGLPSRREGACVVLLLVGHWYVTQIITTNDGGQYYWSREEYVRLDRNPIPGQGLVMTKGSVDLILPLKSLNTSRFQSIAHSDKRSHICHTNLANIMKYN